MALADDGDEHYRTRQSIAAAAPLAMSSVNAGMINNN